MARLVSGRLPEWLPFGVDEAALRRAILDIARERWGFLDLEEDLAAVNRRYAMSGSLSILDRGKVSEAVARDSLDDMGATEVRTGVYRVDAFLRNENERLLSTLREEFAAAVLLDAISLADSFDVPHRDAAALVDPLVAEGYVHRARSGSRLLVLPGRGLIEAGVPSPRQRLEEEATEGTLAYSKLERMVEAPVEPAVVDCLADEVGLDVLDVGGEYLLVDGGVPDTYARKVEDRIRRDILNSFSEGQPVVSAGQFRTAVRSAVEDYFRTALEQLGQQGYRENLLRAVEQQLVADESPLAEKNEGREGAEAFTVVEHGPLLDEFLDGHASRYLRRTFQKTVPGEREAWEAAAVDNFEASTGQPSLDGYLESRLADRVTAIIDQRLQPSTSDELFKCDETQEYDTFWHAEPLPGEEWLVTVSGPTAGSEVILPAGWTEWENRERVITAMLRSPEVFRVDDDMSRLALPHEEVIRYLQDRRWVGGRQVAVAFVDYLACRGYLDLAADEVVFFRRCDKDRSSMYNRAAAAARMRREFQPLLDWVETGTPYPDEDIPGLDDTPPPEPDEDYWVFERLDITSDELFEADSEEELKDYMEMLEDYEKRARKCADELSQAAFNDELDGELTDQSGKREEGDRDISETDDWGSIDEQAEELQEIVNEHPELSFPDDETFLQFTRLWRKFEKGVRDVSKSDDQETTEKQTADKQKIVDELDELLHSNDDK